MVTASSSMEKTLELLRLCSRLDATTVQYSSYKHVEHGPYNELSVAIARTILCMELQYYIPYVVNVWQAADLFNAPHEELVNKAAKIMTEYECGLWNSHPGLPMGLNFLTSGESQPLSSFQLCKVIRAEAGEVITLEWEVRQLETKITQTKSSQEQLLQKVFYIQSSRSENSSSCRIGPLGLELQPADKVDESYVGAQYKCSAKLVPTDTVVRSTPTTVPKSAKDVDQPRLEATSAYPTKTASSSDSMTIPVYPMATNENLVGTMIFKSESSVQTDIQLNIPAHPKKEDLRHIPPSGKTLKSGSGPQAQRTMKFVSRQSFEECINIATSDVLSCISFPHIWEISSQEICDRQTVKKQARCYTIIEQPLLETDENLNSQENSYAITVTEKLMLTEDESSSDKRQPMTEILEKTRANCRVEENSHSTVSSKSQLQLNTTFGDVEPNTLMKRISDSAVGPIIKPVSKLDIKLRTTQPKLDSKFVKEDTKSRSRTKTSKPVVGSFTGVEIKPLLSNPGPGHLNLHSAQPGLFDPERRITARSNYSDSKCWFCGVSESVFNSDLLDWDFQTSLYREQPAQIHQLGSLDYHFSEQTAFDRFLGNQDMDYRLLQPSQGRQICELGDLSRIAGANEIAPGCSLGQDFGLDAVEEKKTKRKRKWRRRVKKFSRRDSSPHTVRFLGMGGRCE